MVHLLNTTLHSDVAEQAARTLSNFMCFHKAQLQVAAAGAAQALVSVLTKCMRGELFHVEALMQQACAAICNLTFENDANRFQVIICFALSHTYTHTHTHTNSLSLSLSLSHTHTHTTRAHAQARLLPPSAGGLEQELALADLNAAVKADPDNAQVNLNINFVDLFCK
jgi:hypothetical protein